MLICRGKIPSVSFPLSLGTFVKHLPTSKPTTFHRCANKTKTLTTTRILNSSYFETLTSRQKEQISLYVDALLHWNQRMNLTAVTEANEVMERHVEDSLAIIPPIQNSYSSHCNASYDNLNLVDVGSGPGLPGLILAIACPGWKVTLLESMNKRCIFLEHVVGLAGLSNVQVVRGRAERFYNIDRGASISMKMQDMAAPKQGGFINFYDNFGQNLGFREVFDVAVARAVAEMRILAEYCLPLVRVGGLFLAAKGHDPEEEVRNAERAIQLMGASVLQLCSVESHSPYGQRTAIVCLKDRSTPRKYPRDPGTPAKLPL